MTNTVYKLEDAGFDRKQVEAITGYLDSATATKADIAELNGRIILLQWMIGLNLAGTISIVVDRFFT